VRPRTIAALAVTALIAVGLGAWLLLRDDDREPSPQDRGQTAIEPADQLQGFDYPAWFQDDDRTIEERLDTVRDAGGDVIRASFGWVLYEPRKGEIDTAMLDRFEWLVDQAEERGIEVIWLLGGAPCEYSAIPPEVLERCLSAPDPFSKPEFLGWPPADEESWRESLRPVLDRVGDRLAAVEVWNEPNNADFLRAEGGDAGRAVTYLEILRWTYPEIKARAPDLPVLAGSLAFADAGFLSDLYLGGLAGLSDGVSVHPYSARPSQGTIPTRPGAITFDGDRVFSFRSGIDAIHEVMAANGEGDLPIWITEFGSGACARGKPLCAGSARRQADWATEAFLVAARNPSVAAVLMHELVDQVDLKLGALEADGTPRPALDAIHRADRLLAEGVRIGSPLRTGCLPAPFGDCVGQPATKVDRILGDPPASKHSYRVELACGPAADGVVDDSGRRTDTDPGLAFSAGCRSPWAPGGDPSDDGQQLAPADGPAEGTRRATLAFIAPGSALMTDAAQGSAADAGLPGTARVIGIEAGHALLRANTTEADVALRTNALAERERGADLVLGCRRGSLGGDSSWPGIPESVCNTFSTVHQTAPGAPDLIAVPADRDVREVVWEIRCPGPCDPEGGPFAARVVLEGATLTIEETDPPAAQISFPDPGTAEVTLSDLMGIESAEVLVEGTRVAAHRSSTCSPSAGKLLRTRVPCPRQSDRRVTLDVELPAGGPPRALEVRATDSLGNRVRKTAELPG